MNKAFAIDHDAPLRQLVAGAEPGEQFELTVDGKVVARVLPQETQTTGDDPEAVMKRIADRAKNMTLSGTSLRELIDEGRKS